MADPSKRKVLLVDDDADVRDALRGMLEEIGGLSMTEAGDGEQAISAMANTHFDLLLLDINLPLVGGEGVLAKIMRGSEVIRPGYVAVISGADRLDQSRDRLQMIGADTLIAKPFHLTDIEKLVSEVAAQPT